jgi:hypothetical protein
VVLLCVWWVPTDAAAHPVFAAHDDAAARLAAALPDEHVTRLCLTYPQLWAHWADIGDGALREHVQRLRKRYGVSLGD